MNERFSHCPLSIVHCQLIIAYLAVFTKLAPMTHPRLRWYFFLTLLLLSACKPPRCPLDSCHVRMRHSHGNQPYRGVPFWKRNKDPKYGQDYRSPNEGDQKKAAKSAKERRKRVVDKKKESQDQ